MSERDNRSRRVIIIDEHSNMVPYSKGLTASAIMASGVHPSRAYDIAADIEEGLIERGEAQVREDDLHRLIFRTIREDMGERYAGNYEKYHSLSRMHKPLVILIGGSTGVGKSTIATMLATRLGIVRIVSTDAVREVMRAFFARELMPAIHTSSFAAGSALRHPLPEEVDPVVAGFRDQTTAVLVGVRALINRAITEGTHIIIEGTHVAPGFVKPEDFPGAFVEQLIITVKDEALHRSHFYIREMETQGSRPFLRYVEHFEDIRRIQEYLVEESEKRGVRIIDSVNLDVTIAEVVEEVLNSVQELEEAERRRSEEPRPGSRPAGAEATISGRY